MKIFHPGYGTPKMHRVDNDFFFSENIERWGGKSQKIRREKENKEKVKRKYKPRKKHGH